MGDRVEQRRHGAQIAAGRGAARRGAAAGRARSPVTSRRRRMARPPIVRPSASTKPAPAARAVRRKPRRAAAAARARLPRRPHRRARARSRRRAPRFAGGALARDRRIALEARLAVAAEPADEELALRADEQVGAIVRAAQGAPAPAAARARPAAAPPLAQEHQGRGGREGDEAHEEAERGGVVEVEARAGNPGGRRPHPARAGCTSAARAGQDVSGQEAGPAGRARAGTRRGRQRSEIAARAAIAVPSSRARPCRAASFLKLSEARRAGQMHLMPRLRLSDATGVIPPTPERNCRPGSRNRSTAGRIACTLDHAATPPERGLRPA